MERREIREMLVLSMDRKVNKERKVIWERWGHQEPKVNRVSGEIKVQLVRKACRETQACKGLKENRESRVHHQEESPTLAGVGQPAPLTRELSWCIQAELGELTWNGQEAEPTISACQMIQTTWTLHPECRAPVICAVCYVATRSVSLMIPAKTQCPTLWTLEYFMSQAIHHAGRACVDKDPESVPGLDTYSEPRAIFFLTEPQCNGLSCEPYNAKMELTCTVCTR